MNPSNFLKKIFVPAFNERIEIDIWHEENSKYSIIISAKGDRIAKDIISSLKRYNNRMSHSEDAFLFHKISVSDLDAREINDIIARIKNLERRSIAKDEERYIASLA